MHDAAFNIAIDDVTKVYNSQKAKIKNLQEENEYLKTKAYKDEEIKKLTDKIEQLRDEQYKGFFMSQVETEAAMEWQKAHIQDVHDGHSYAGAVGGLFSYVFTPTGIGICGEIECNRCHERFCFCELG